MSAFDGGMFVVLVLDLIVHENPFETALSAKDIYTLKRKRKIFAANSAIGILQLFRQAIELCGLSQDEDLRQHVLRLVSSSSALELLRTFATQNLDLLKIHVVEPLLQEGKPQYTSWLLLLVDNLLDDNDCNDNTEVDAHVQVARLLDLANDFSIDLCKLKMQIILNSDRLESDPSGGDVTFDGGVGDVHSNTIARSIIRGIASTSQDRRKICTDLITVLNKDCAAKLRADVEELFLDCNSFLRTRQLIEQLDLPLAYDQATSGEALARAFLAIIDATSTASVFVGSQFITSTLVERIATLLQIVASTCCDTDDDVLPEFPLAEFRCWLVLFLRLVVLHRPAFLQQSRGGLEQARMLARLCCLLQQDVVHNDDAYFEMVLGVASSFADGLPDDTRLQLRRYIKGKRQVPMGAYILGAPLDGAENLRARQQKGEIVEFALKPWERLAEPAPNFGENDVTLSLVLFRTRRF
jgi:mediator of RNA polymerase II transcription subunit 12